MSVTVRPANAGMLRELAGWHDDQADGLTRTDLIGDPYHAHRFAAKTLGALADVTEKLTPEHVAALHWWLDPITEGLDETVATLAREALSALDTLAAKPPEAA